MLPGTTPLPVAQPPPGSKGELVFAYDEIDQQQVTNTLRISVTRDLDAPGVCLNSATVSAKLGYADSCGVWKGNAVQDSGKLTALRPDLSGFTQTPVSQTVTAGAIYTWTLTLPNQGTGPAHNLFVTQTLPAGLAFITATVGSSGSITATPTVADMDGSTVITWDVGNLPPGETWSAETAARPLAARNAYSITAEVHAACDDGGCQQSSLATSFNAPLQSLGKQISQGQVSIGEPFVYTITADFYGSVPYTGTQIVDTLPELGGGWCSATRRSLSTPAAPVSWTADTATPRRDHIYDRRWQWRRNNRRSQQPNRTSAVGSSRMR